MKDEKILVRMMLARAVKNQAPKKPSKVFFGEISISLVRPKVIPHRYAKISLTITSPHGNKNQINPLITFLMIKWACPTTNINTM